MKEEEVRNIIADHPAGRVKEIADAAHTIGDQDDYDCYVFTSLSANRVLTLPTLSKHFGKEIWVDNPAGSYDIELTPAGTDNINGANSAYDIGTQHGLARVRATTAEWRVNSFFGSRSYDTGWINRSDWTNVHLGTTDTKNTDSNVNHALSANLSDLLAKVLVSTDGTENNSFEITSGYDNVTGGVARGLQVEQVDTNNLLIQTGLSGILTLDTAGDLVSLDAEDWYYKVKVYRII